MVCQIYNNENDLENDFENAKNTIGNIVILNPTLYRFHVYANYQYVKLKIVNVHLSDNSYITCDLSHIDDDTIVLRDIHLMHLQDPNELYVGETVRFHEKVFDEPYTPYYDEYAGYVFVIEEIITEDEEDGYKPVTHYKLRCLNGDVIVQGNIHQDEIVATWKLP